MTYKYSLKRLVVGTVVASTLFILINIKHLQALAKGSLNKYLAGAMFIALIIIIAAFLNLYFRIKNVYICTDNNGLIFKSSKEESSILWKDIISVKRILGGIIVPKGIIVETVDKSISFYPAIKPEDTPQKAIRFGISIKARNLFKNCDLLQEIRQKAKNAKFEGFPEGSFKTS